ncbi:MAG: Hsp20/alpha crystallin family protein [Candidatus Diapherotrites archaeon]|nr:Hsp20/alpha crystallin family protein [Candidatus Diapherotrites archaeon]
MFDDDFFSDFDDLESWFFGKRANNREGIQETGHSQLVHDIWESENKVFVTVELPGKKEKDIDLRVSANRLFIKVKQEGTENQSDYYTTIRLPSAVKEKPTSKTFKNGILEIIFEKSNGSGQRIEVR